MIFKEKVKKIGFMQILKKFLESLDGYLGHHYQMV